MVDLFNVFLIFTTAFVAQASAEKYRPCDFRDIMCMRNFLAARSSCNPNTVGYLPHEFVYPAFQTATSFYNASYVDYNLLIRNGDNCYVSEFFINPVTGTIVISTTCPNSDLSSTRQLIRHEFKEEDKYYTFQARNIYPELSLTVNLLAENNYDLCSSRVSLYLSALPKVTLKANDAETENVLKEYFSDLQIYEQESAYYRAYQTAFDIINQVICDFNCEYQRIINF